MRGRLTPRERRIVGLLGTDATLGEIGAELGISPHTVKAHITNAFLVEDVHCSRALVGKVLGRELAQCRDLVIALRENAAYWREGCEKAEERLTEAKRRLGELELELVSS